MYIDGDTHYWPVRFLDRIKHSGRGYLEYQKGAGAMIRYGETFPGDARGNILQRNYYERVVRNDHELQKIREYIANNPAQWALDRENPEEGVYQYAPTDGIEEIFGGIRP